MTDRMKVLIAYDSLACADAVLDDLRRAGLQAEAECEVLSVDRELAAAAFRAGGYRAHWQWSATSTRPDCKQGPRGPTVPWKWCTHKTRVE
jgi:hypothetical protein